LIRKRDAKKVGNNLLFAEIIEQIPLTKAQMESIMWVFVLSSILMISESLFEGTLAAAQVQKGMHKETADMLYFVDSISSFDDRMQKIARATAKLLTITGVDFGILGKAERDSGHEIRRFGEEILFVDLKEKNSEAISSSKVNSIVTSDPHAFNALKNDYQGMPVF